MLELAKNGYTRQEVIDALHGRSGSRSEIKFRYDLLNKEEIRIGELTAQPGRVAMNSLAEIKRTAVFKVTENEAQDIDWLNDRIRPVFCLRMPAVCGTYKAWGSIDATFSRSSAAYLSDGRQVAANQPRFEPGKFGKAVMVEEGTTNIITNGNCEEDYPKLDGKIELGINCKGELDTSVTHSGNKSLKMTTTSVSGSADRYIMLGAYAMNGLTAGQTYTFSAWVYVPSGQGINLNNVMLRFYDYTDAYEVYYSNTPTAYDTWQRLTVTRTIRAEATRAFVRLYIYQDIQNVYVYWDDIQLEQKPYATSFIDGTRAGEILKLFDHAQTIQYFPANASWRLGLRVKVNNIDKSRIRSVYSCTQNGGFNLYYQSAENCSRVAMHDGTTYQILNFLTTYPFDDLQWHKVDLIYDYENHKARLYLDGIKQSEIDIMQLHYGTSNAFVLGTESTGGGGSTTEILNGLIDDVIISNRAPTDEEILAEYQRNKPHLIDQWTTAKFSFDDKLSGDYFTLVDRDIPAQWIEWPLGVFLLSSPTRRNENRKIKREIEAYDASLILKEDKFTDRYFIPAGTRYAAAILDILNSAGLWKINIQHFGSGEYADTWTTDVDREFEIGTEKLFAVNELLAAINYTSLWIDENGYARAQPYVLPTFKDPEYEYRNDELSIIHPDSGIEELDLFGVPNKWVRYVENPDRALILRSEYTNDNATSPTSTVNRGRIIVDIDSVDDVYDQDTLDELVKRIAYNASQIYGRFIFSTALMPHHSYYDCLFIEHSDFGIAHKYMESSWSMDLRAGGAMSHSVRRVIQI